MERQLKAELWQQNESAYQHSVEDRIRFAHNNNPVIFPIVVENNEIISMQPWSPITGNDWETEEEALAWAKNWIVADIENSKNIEDISDDLGWKFINEEIDSI